MAIPESTVRLTPGLCHAVLVGTYREQGDEDGAALFGSDSGISGRAISSKSIARPAAEGSYGVRQNFRCSHTALLSMAFLQSTPDQLLNNPESRRRQYASVERARALGWENAIVVDEDLGRSGGGQLRPGFERLLATICAGTAGAVLAIEASRLA